MKEAGVIELLVSGAKPCCADGNATVSVGCRLSGVVVVAVAAVSYTHLRAHETA